MKTASMALLAAINAARGAPDAQLSYADCFLFMLQSGATCAWTNVDFPITFNGTLYSSAGPLVQGLKYKSSVGLEVDKQQITLAARATDLIAGAQALVAIQGGAFDGATVQRYRVFLTVAPPSLTVIDGVLLFQGRVSTVDSVGRLKSQITVASSLVILDYDMPKNYYAATCQHTLYDTGCGLNRASFASTGALASGSTSTLINWSGALATHAQGVILFSSGVNSGLRANVKSAVPGVSLTLMYPLPTSPSVGDAFTAYLGCDHTQGTCAKRFNNVANFRGFPFVPPPVMAY